MIGDLEYGSSVYCIVDGCWGIYVPQRFVTAYDPGYWGVSADDVAVLLAGPDHEHYWDTWDAVLCNAVGRNGELLEQDGDLFVVIGGRE